MDMNMKDYLLDLEYVEEFGEEQELSSFEQIFVIFKKIMRYTKFVDWSIFQSDFGDGAEIFLHEFENVGYEDFASECKDIEKQFIQMGYSTCLRFLDKIDWVKEFPGDEIPYCKFYSKLEIVY